MEVFMSVVEYDNNDSSILNTLSDKEIFLDSASITTLCSTWKSRVNELNLNSNRVNSAFKTFSENGILENYIVCLSTAINSLTITVNNISDTINDNKDNQIVIDNSYSNSNRNSTSSSSLPSNDNNNFTSVIDNIDVNDYANISVITSDFLISTNTSIDNIFNNDVQISNLKKILLNSVNISSDLKNIIANMDSSIFKQFLKKLYTNNNIYTASSEEITFIKAYLEEISKANNIDYNLLITDINNNKFLYSGIHYYKEALTYIESIINEDINVFRQKIFDIYDGNSISEMDSNLVFSIRSILASLSSIHNVSCEELINGDIKNYLSQVTTSKQFVELLSETRLENFQSMLFTILK